MNKRLKKHFAYWPVSIQNIINHNNHQENVKWNYNEITSHWNNNLLQELTLLSICTNVKSLAVPEQRSSKYTTWVSKRQKNWRSNWQYLLPCRKAKRFPEKNFYFCFIDYAKAFDCVQSLSHFQLFATPWTAASQASLSFTISQSLLKFMSIESVKPSNHLILCHHLLLPPSIFPSIRAFSKLPFPSP